MIGFAASTVAVLFTAWIVYAATRRAAYLDGIHDANQQWRRELAAVRSDDPCIRYMVSRFSAGRAAGFTRANLYAGVVHENVVPAGTLHVRKNRAYEAIADTTGWTGDQHEFLKRDHIHFSQLHGMTAAELRARVDRDDGIYGRNG